MAIFGTVEEVAFAFTGIQNSNSSWTCIEDTIDAEDVILFQGRIYVIAYGGTLKVYDINAATPPKAIEIAESPPTHIGTSLDNSDTFYLVEIGGNLHFVARYYDPGEKDTDDHCYSDPGEKDTDEDCFFEPDEKDTGGHCRSYVTIGFRVWRFDFSNTEWYELDGLGENALFLGNNSSFAISTITYPDFSKNCIYFTDDRRATYNDQSCDMGVYDYQERTIKKPFDIANIGAISKFSRPTFFLPTLSC